MEHKYIKVLLLSKYSGNGASTRVRAFQYISFLERSGIEVTVSSFFDDGYLTYLYSTGRRRFRDVFPRYLKRFSALRDAGKYSALWIEKEVFPFLPAWFENLVVRTGVPYIVDYDDATFHTYDQHRSSLVRGLLSKKYDPLLASAKCVTVGNSYLESYVRSHGAKDIRLIPTVVDIRRYDVTEESDFKELRIGWIGSPATAKYLYLVRDVLKELSAERPIRLVTIGAPPLLDYGVPLEQHPWSEDTETQLLASIHVGIMPLPDNPWERGKCGYKLIQYMACGRPVVASPVGVNRDIVTNVVGYLADGPEEWVQSLRALADNPGHRRACGVAGRRLAEREYSLQVTAPRVVDILREAANTRGSRTPVRRTASGDSRNG